MIETQDIAEAIDRIARTPDGIILYRFLQKTLCAVPPSEQTDGALREFEGRRRFAAELMGHMSEGIQDSDRHTITFSSSGARTRDPAKRGAARRVTLDTPVAGWDAVGPRDSAGRHGSDAA